MVLATNEVQVVSMRAELITGRSPEAPGSEVTGTEPRRALGRPRTGGRWGGRGLEGVCWQRAGHARGVLTFANLSRSLWGLCKLVGFAQTSENDPECLRANPWEQEGARAVELNPFNRLGRVRPAVTGTVTYHWSSTVPRVAEPGSIPPNMLKTLCKILINISGSCWGLYQTPRALWKVNGLSSPRGDHVFTQLSEVL